jgi:hypothetical protein
MSLSAVMELQIPEMTYHSIVLSWFTLRVPEKFPSVFNRVDCRPMSAIAIVDNRGMTI